MSPANLSAETKNDNAVILETLLSTADTVDTGYVVEKDL